MEELNQKEKELLEAQVEVTKAQHSLTDEKKKIDKEIKEKLEQNEKLKLEFEKRAASSCACFFCTAARIASLRAFRILALMASIWASMSSWISSWV